MKNFKTMNVAVCQGRHDIPQATDGAIFETTILVMDPQKLYHQALDALTNCYQLVEGDQVNLYITGLTMATIAIINACHTLNLKLTCWHYDRDQDGYVSQSVL